MNRMTTIVPASIFLLCSINTLLQAAGAEILKEGRPPTMLSSQAANYKKWEASIMIPTLLGLIKGQVSFESIPLESIPPSTLSVHLNNFLNQKAIDNNPFVVTAQTLINAARSGNHSIILYCIRQGVSINSQDENGINALMCAKDYNTVDIILQNNALLDLTDKTGKTALMHAFIREDWSVVQLLLEKGALILSNNEGMRALICTLQTYRTLKQKIVDAVQDKICLLYAKYTQPNFLTRISPTNLEKELNTLLETAEKKCVFQCIKKLITKVDITKVESSLGESILLAAINTEDEQVVALLLPYYLSTIRGTTYSNKPTGQGLALIKAAMLGCGNIVDQLITAGVSVNSRDDQGRTPLMWAACKGHHHVVEMLLSWGAADLKDDEGNTALILTAECENRNVSRVINEAGKTLVTVPSESPTNTIDTIVRRLIYSGAKSSTTNKKGLTALDYANNLSNLTFKHSLIEAEKEYNSHLRSTLLTAHQISPYDTLLDAIDSNDATAVELLLKEEVDLNEKDTSGNTPLINATIKRNTKIVEMLIEAGANINAAGKELKTPLMWATHDNNVELVRYFIHAGAQVNAQDKTRNTALIYAAQAGHVEIVQELILAGASIVKKNDNDQTAYDVALLEKQAANADKQNRYVAIEQFINALVEEIDARFVDYHRIVKGEMDEFAKRKLGATLDNLLKKDEEYRVDYAKRKGISITGKPQSTPLNIVERKETDAKNKIRNMIRNIGLRNECKLENVHNVRLLLNEGVDPSTPKTYEWFQEISLNNEHASTCNCDTCLEVPLIIATKAGNSSIVRLLISADANINAIDSETKQNALYCALFKAEHYRRLREDYVSQKKEPAQYAEFAKHENEYLAIAKMLIHAGIKLEITDHILNITYMLTTSYKEINELILNKAYKRPSLTPLIEAVKCTTTLESIDNLIKYYAKCEDINKRDTGRMTALLYAAKMGNRPLVAFLLNNNADANVTDNEAYSTLDESNKKETIANSQPLNGRNALHYASAAGHTDCVVLLVNHINPNKINDLTGYTPLMEAAFEGHTEIIKILVEHGADLELKNNQRKTALEIAQDNKKKAAISLLTQLRKTTPTVSAANQQNRPLAQHPVVTHVGSIDSNNQGRALPEVVSPLPATASTPPEVASPLSAVASTLPETVSPLPSVTSALPPKTSPLPPARTALPPTRRGIVLPFVKNATNPIPSLENPYDNRCFMNAALQCLAQFTGLSEAISEAKETLDKNSITYAFADFLEQYHNKSITGTHSIKQTCVSSCKNLFCMSRSLFFRADDIKRQQDPHDFLTQLLDKVRESVESVGELGKINIRYLTNGTSDTVSPSYFLQTLSMDGNEQNLSDCLDRSFNDPSQQCMIEALPRYFILSLKRTAFDVDKKQNFRLNNAITFELSNLSLQKYSLRLQLPPYQLIGVIWHSGESANSGHYIALVKHNDQWYLCNDATVHPISIETMIRIASIGKINVQGSDFLPVMFFYKPQSEDARRR